MIAAVSTLKHFAVTVGLTLKHYPINEQPNYHIMHHNRLGKANRYLRFEVKEDEKRACEASFRNITRYERLL